jgi:hypothetical protein
LGKVKGKEVCLFRVDVVEYVASVAQLSLMHQPDILRKEVTVWYRFM